MKKQYIVFLFIFFIFTFFIIANAQINTPRPSPKSTLTQVVGVTDVSVTYSRPGVKGRIIFGDLVPFGKVWRTGANESTTLKFGDAVALDGHKVPAGEYALFTIPGEKEWTIIISKNIGWGNNEYNEKEI